MTVALRLPTVSSERRAPLPLVLLALWLAAPLVPIVLWSVARGWFFPDLLPVPDLTAWSRVADPATGIAAAFGTGLVVALMATALAMAAGIPAGWALGVHDVPGRRVLELLIAAPAVVPGIAVAMGLHAVFLRLGLGGSIAGVALVHAVMALPYTVLVLSAVFAGHDPAYEAQARTLGAGRLQVIRHVTLPMIAPGLAVAAAFAFLVSWSQYATTLLIGAGRVPTLPLQLMQFHASGRLDVVGVVAVLTVLPGVLVLVLSAGPLSRARPARRRRRP